MAPACYPELALPRFPDIAWVRSVLQRSRSRGLRRRVLFALALTADRSDGLTSAGRELIAAVAGCHRAKVSSAIAQLAQIGEVEVVSHGGGRGKRSVLRVTAKVTPPAGANGVQRAPFSQTVPRGHTTPPETVPRRHSQAPENGSRNGAERTQEVGKVLKGTTRTPRTPRERGADEQEGGSLRRRGRNPRTLGTNPRALDRAARQPPAEIEQRWQAVVSRAADRLGSRASAFLVQIHHLELGWRDHTLLLNGPTRGCVRERYGRLLDELAAAAGLPLEPLEPERNRRRRRPATHGHVA